MKVKVVIGRMCEEEEEEEGQEQEQEEEEEEGGGRKGRGTYTGDWSSLLFIIVPYLLSLRVLSEYYCPRNSYHPFNRYPAASSFTFPTTFSCVIWYIHVCHMQLAHQHMIFVNNGPLLLFALQLLCYYDNIL